MCPNEAVMATATWAAAAVLKYIHKNRDVAVAKAVIS